MTAPSSSCTLLRSKPPLANVSANYPSRRVGFFGLAAALTYLGAGLGASAWAQTTQTKILAPDAQSGDFFGYSVLLDEDSLFVGATARSSGNGGAYAYADTQNTAAPPLFLSAPDGSNNVYGTSFARAGNTLVIGAERSAVTVGEAPISAAGAVFVYTQQPDNSWLQTQKLQASDAASGSRFGASVAMSSDGKTLMIGAPRRQGIAVATGGVYVFERANEAEPWTERSILTADAVVGTNGQLGQEIALHGDDAMIGLPRYDQNDGNGVLRDSGAVLAFSRLAGQGGNWTQVQIIRAPTPTARAEFGRSIDLAPGGRAVIGSPNDSVNGPFHGAVYSLQKSANGMWEVEQRLDPAAPVSGVQFGYDVDLSPNGQLLALGVPADSGAAVLAGAAYVYPRTGSGLWRDSLFVRVQAQDAAARDSLGFALSINNSGTLAAGVRNRDEGGSNAGATYLFQVDVPTAPAPVTGGFGLLALGAGLAAMARRKRA